MCTDCLQNLSNKKDELVRRWQQYKGSRGRFSGHFSGLQYGT